MGNFFARTNTEGGPLRGTERRVSTDCVCSVLFVIFLIGMVIVSGIAIATGSMYHVNGYDSYGNSCGNMNERVPGRNFAGMDMREMPYVFYMDIVSFFNSTMICVKACPPKNLENLKEVKAFAKKNDSKLCLYDVGVNKYLKSRQSKNGPCPVNMSLQKSTAFLNRCIPDDLVKQVKAMIEHSLKLPHFFDDVLADLLVTRWAILAMCGLAFVSAPLMVFFIGYASHLVWFAYGILIALTVGVSSFTGYAYKLMEAGMETELVYFYRFGIDMPVLFIGSVMFSIYLMFIWKRVAFAIELLKQSSKALRTMPRLMALAIWAAISILLVLFVVVCLMIKMLLLWNVDSTIYYEEMWYLTGLVWIGQFIVAYVRYLVAACVADWFFTRDKENFTSPILRNIKHLLRYHVGSIAFGSLLVGIYAFKPPLRLTRDFFACLIISVFTIIAIKGKNFIISAYKVIIIVASNFIRFTTTYLVLLIFVCIYLACVICFSALSGIVFLQGFDELHYNYVPYIAAAILAVFVCAPYGIIIQAIVISLFFCVLEDGEEMDDGSPKKPKDLGAGLKERASDSEEDDDEDNDDNKPPDDEDDEKELMTLLRKRNVKPTEQKLKAERTMKDAAAKSINISE